MCGDVGTNLEVRAWPYQVIYVPARRQSIQTTCGITVKGRRDGGDEERLDYCAAVEGRRLCVLGKERLAAFLRVNVLVQSIDRPYQALASVSVRVMIPSDRPWGPPDPFQYAKIVTNAHHQYPNHYLPFFQHHPSHARPQEASSGQARVLGAGSGGGWNGIGGLSVWQQRGDGAPDGARTGRWPATGLGRPSLVSEATAAAASSDVVVRTMVEAGLEANATL